MGSCSITLGWSHRIGAWGRCLAEGTTGGYGSAVTLGGTGSGGTLSLHKLWGHNVYTMYVNTLCIYKCTCTCIRRNSILAQASDFW